GLVLDYDASGDAVNEAVVNLRTTYGGVSERSAFSGEHVGDEVRGLLGLFWVFQLFIERLAEGLHQALVLHLRHLFPLFGGILGGQVLHAGGAHQAAMSARRLRALARPIFFMWSSITSKSSRR